MTLIRLRTGADNITTHFCRHDETRRCRVNCDISGHQTNILEFRLEFSEFLIGQGLNMDD